METGAVYEVRFVLTEGLENAVPSESPKSNGDEKSMSDKTPKSTDEIISDKDAKKRKAKIVAQVSTALGVTMIAVNTYLNYQNTNYQIQGDFIAAQKLQSTQQQVNEFVGLASTVGAGFALGGLPGGIAAIAYTAYNLSLRAINYSNDVRKYMAQVEINIKEAEYEQQRLIANISEVR